LRNWWSDIFCTVCGAYDVCLFDKVGGKRMKKAMKFSDWCYKTLSEEEVKMLNDAIDTICENHENEPWSKVYLAITKTVNLKLVRMAADEMLDEQEVED
jgi:predicted alpha-1,6-mannanase (GH76 family)